METVEWAYGSAEVSPTAAMLDRISLRLPTGAVQPFARAPWLDRPDPAAAGLVGHRRVLAGDFVGVPFGAGGRPAELAPDWRDLIPEQPPAPPHGLSADADWSLRRVGRDRVDLDLDYPDDHDIARLQRTVAGDPDRPGLRLGLTITARREARVPIGLHPILGLPQRPGALRLKIDFDTGFTYPGRVSPGSGPTAIWRRFDRLDRVPARDGGTVDLSRLPLGPPVEDIVQLCGVRYPVRLINDEERYELELDWDRTILPHLLIWLSDRGQLDPPWHGAFRGLGLEPVAAAFDFDPALSAAPNPLSEAGFPTAVALTPDYDTVIDYGFVVDHESRNA